MNTLIAVSIAAYGIGDKLSNEVAETIKVIQKSGLPIKLLQCLQKSKESGMRL